MISIVIPALNEEKLLPSCLDSLRKQDYSGEYEIIVADNGSSDKTADISRDFGVKVIICSGRRGVFYARQAGADAASGDIIAQADADTVYPADWLKRIAARFVTHPGTVAVTGRYAYRDPPYWSKVEYLARHYLNRVTAKLFRRPLLVSGATFAFRRQAFCAAGGYQGISYSPDQYGIAERLNKLGMIEYDQNLRILTSSRTVKKPLFIIVKDVLVHICRLGIHLWACLSAEQQVNIKRTRRQVAARLLPVPVIVILLVGTHGCLVPSSQVFGQVYYEGNPSERAVALTFDNGLVEPYTSEVLDILASYGVKATFFVSGDSVELYPEIARRITGEGHVIGNQSYHQDTFHAFSQHNSEDLKIAQEIIFTTVGVNPHLYRPPGGTKTPWELENVEELGMIPITWGVSIDGLSLEADVREITGKIEAGEIIRLLDDSGKENGELKSDYYPVVKALPLIIEQLRGKGYRLVTVPELLGVPAYNQAAK